jgi:putative transposase
VRLYNLKSWRSAINSAFYTAPSNGLNSTQPIGFCGPACAPFGTIGAQISSSSRRPPSSTGIDIGETSVSKYIVRHRRPPSQTWRTFLENHAKSVVSVDFFTVPTIRFQILYVFLVLAHERRRILHFAVAAHPTAEWKVQQLREAFPWETAPRYLLRDRDQIFGKDFVDQVKALGIKQVLSTTRSPWQRAYVERLIGTIRRDCLDHVIVFHNQSLRRHLRAFVDYYHRSRTRLGLQKDTPEARPIQAAEAGRIIAIPEVGGLHHRYERRAA